MVFEALPCRFATNLLKSIKLSFTPLPAISNMHYYGVVFLLSVSIPILTLSLFPSSMGNDIYCMLFYYPLLFLIGGLSAWTYYRFRDRIKLNKTVLFLLILMLDFAILTSFYPKGKYSPTNQLRVARQEANDYKNLKPVDIFKAIDDRNFLRITALYHKFNLPTEFYVVTGRINLKCSSIRLLKQN